MVEEAKKVLVLRFGALGDIVHTTIIPQAIKAAHPDYEVHYCCEARYVDVLRNNPDIDKIIEFDHKRKKDFSYNLETALKLRHEHYDVVLNLTNAFRNNFMTFIANPKEKFGKVPMGHKHVVDAFFLAAQQAFPELKQPKNLRLGLDSQLLEKMKTRLENYPRPFVIFSPGGQTDNNRQGRAWPAKNWIGLGKLLKQIYGGTIFISGSPAEKEYHSTIAEALEGSVLFSGEFSISESMCLFSECDLFVSGDSGPLHIASGLGVKTLGIFGSTNPENVRPYGQKGNCVEPVIECKFCWKKECKRLKEGQKYTPCIKSIKPEHVLHVINSKKLLGTLEEKPYFM
ncbi:MAG: glycosyltransferase family 9 protein [Fusobacterium sp.]|nr:glycosyltransferase family 9 protein [Fusobacterium sp.]